MPCASSTSRLHPGSRTGTACTPRAGERRCAGPPPSQHAPPQTSPGPVWCPVVLRTSRTSPTAKPQPERTPGAPDWISPMSSPPRSSAPAIFCRRPACPFAQSRPILIQRLETDLEPSQFPSVPVSAVGFAKDPSLFSVFNPRSKSVQKKLQFCPVFSVLAPNLFKIRTRDPASVVLCVSPWIYPLITF